MTEISKKEFHRRGLEYARDNTGLDGHGTAGSLCERFAKWYAVRAYGAQSFTDVSDIGHYFLLWENGMEP
jgi:hypothetical protein